MGTKIFGNDGDREGFLRRVRALRWQERELGHRAKKIAGRPAPRKRRISTQPPALNNSIQPQRYMRPQIGLAKTSTAATRTCRAGAGETTCISWQRPVATRPVAT